MGGLPPAMMMSTSSGMSLELLEMLDIFGRGTVGWKCSKTLARRLAGSDGKVFSWEATIIVSIEVSLTIA